MIRIAGWFVALSLIMSAVATTAQAHEPWFFGGFYGPWGHGYSWHSRNHVPTPPYFALHPPVYYSHQITARHYGASPFAWPAGYSQMVVAPRVAVPARVEPVQAGDQVVVNPYVDQGSELAKNRPLVIENPYYVSTR